MRKNIYNFSVFKFFLLFLLYISLIIFNCSIQDNSNGKGDEGEDEDDNSNIIYKQYMRSFVQNISTWAKAQKTGFIIIPQNGHELATIDGDNNGPPNTAYIAAIDGAGQEDLFFGYNNDDEATPTVERDYLLDFLNIYEDNGVEVLVTDYCSTVSNMNDSYTQNASRGFISFAADHRELDNIPGYPTNPYNENTFNIITLSNAKNFLYLLNPDTTVYTSKADFVSAIDTTNYDVILIDLYYYDNSGTEFELDITDINNLKTKPSGSSRLVICYMSIGEAEDYRYYWDTSWETNPPEWMAEENPDWPGKYKVRYWYTEWQDIIFGNNSSYLQKIIDAEFDGVYLDIIDAFEYFED